MKLQQALRALTHEELARRIQVLDLGVTTEEQFPTTEPRWIDPAELVRRIAPYLSEN